MGSEPHIFCASHGFALAPKAPCHFEPRASPQGIRIAVQPSAESAFQIGRFDQTLAADESRFQRWRFEPSMTPGRCPRLKMNATALALNINAHAPWQSLKRKRPGRNTTWPLWAKPPTIKQPAA